MISLDSIVLPADLLWSDELDWSGAAASVKRTLLGKQVVQAAAIPSDAGRPLTLGNDDAWIDRSDLLVLQQWAGEPGREMLLTLHDGHSFRVVFRHWDKPVILATPVVAYADPDAGARYRLQALKLAQI